MFKNIVLHFKKEKARLSKNEDGILYKNKIKLCEDLLFGLSRHIDAFTEGKPNGSFQYKLKNLEAIPVDFVPNKKGQDLSKQWVKNNQELFLEISKLFLNPDYKPPINIIELQAHLTTVWILYAAVFPQMKSIPCRVLILIDHALALLAVQTSVVVMKIIAKGGYLDQSKKGLSKIAKRRVNNKQAVIDFYYRLTVRTRKTKKPYTIAGLIKEKYPEKTGPSTKTIVRYLRQEGIIS